MILQVEQFKIELAAPYKSGMAISADEAEVLNEEHISRLRRNIRRWQEAGWTKSQINLAVQNFRIGDAWASFKPESDRQKRARALLEFGL